MNIEKIYDCICSQSEKPSDIKKLLRDFLIVSNFIYSKIGSLAVDYGNGIHPKHRLTKYHDFFVNNIDENNTVLDLGSGRGDVSFDVACKTKESVIGMDISIFNCRHAMATYKLSNLSFINGNIYTDIPLKHFDVVILSNVLEHLDNRVDILSNIKTKTTPQKILLRVPYFERDWVVAMKKEMGVDYFLDKTHKIEYTEEEFCEEMKRANIEITKMLFKWGEIWAVCKPYPQ